MKRAGAEGSPREALEKALRHYSALTVGERLCLHVGGKDSMLEVLEVRGGGRRAGEERVGVGEQLPECSASPSSALSPPGALPLPRTSPTRHHPSSSPASR